MRTNKWEVVLYRYWTELGGGKPKLCGHGFKSTWQKSKHDLAWKLWDPVVHIVQIIHVFQTYTFFKWYSNTSYKPYTLTIRTHHAKIYIEPYEHCPYIQIMQCELKDTPSSKHWVTLKRGYHKTNHLQGKTHKSGVAWRRHQWAEFEITTWRAAHWTAC